MRMSGGRIHRISAWYVELPEGGAASPLKRQKRKKKKKKKKKKLVVLGCTWTVQAFQASQ
jgi:hypothetical protein